jgi:DNA-directed RNA polymerase subunit M/transcription elongation factor TFIIS
MPVEYGDAESRRVAGECDCDRDDAVSAVIQQTRKQADAQPTTRVRCADCGAIVPATPAPLGGGE